MGPSPSLQPSALLLLDGIPVAILILTALASGTGLAASLTHLFGNPHDRRLGAYGLPLGLASLAAACALLIARDSLQTPPPLRDSSSQPATWALLATFLLAEILVHRYIKAPGRNPQPQHERSWPARTLALARYLIPLGLLGISARVALASGAILPTNLGLAPASTWVGALALASAAAMGLAAVCLLASRTENASAEKDALARAQQLLTWTLLVQALLLTGLLLALGPVSDLAFGQAQGRLIPLALIPIGLVLPSLFLLRNAWGGRRWPLTLASLAVLAGGIALRLGLHGLPTPLLAYPY
jgi:hypothetical protein